MLRREALARIGVAALVLAAGAASPAAGRPPRTFTIVIDKMRFGPIPSDLRVGDAILWVNHDMFVHTATASDKSFDVELPIGKSARIELTRPGAVAFTCRYHPGMKGRLLVRPAART
ncbi:MULTISPECIES: cupredoxin domain-containing protein [Phenylobacterium]|uniref:Plastocyanin n=1 Tax=Phenylobacterium koreense TaxID=266125 RepID=A0ABV2EDQ1_9CAUL